MCLAKSLLPPCNFSLPSRTEFYAIVYLMQSYTHKIIHITLDKNNNYRVFVYAKKKDIGKFSSLFVLFCSSFYVFCVCTCQTQWYEEEVCTKNNVHDSINFNWKIGLALVVVNIILCRTTTHEILFCCSCCTQNVTNWTNNMRILYPCFLCIILLSLS